jgi:predicted ABC-type ATPase
MTNVHPKIVVLAGPNGAGKSTSAAKLLRGVLKVDEFVNADTIAQGLSVVALHSVAVQAGRSMLAVGGLPISPRVPLASQCRCGR